jgi:hypothetical protein
VGPDQSQGLEVDSIRVCCLFVICLSQGVAENTDRRGAANNRSKLRGKHVEGEILKDSTLNF